MNTSMSKPKRKKLSAEDKKWERVKVDFIKGLSAQIKDEPEKPFVPTPGWENEPPMAGIVLPKSIEEAREWKRIADEELAARLPEEVEWMVQRQKCKTPEEADRWRRIFTFQLSNPTGTECPFYYDPPYKKWDPEPDAAKEAEENDGEAGGQASEQE